MIRGEWSPKCPSCHRLAPKLVQENDDGTGVKRCVPCKRAIRNNERITWKFSESKAVEA